MAHAKPKADKPPSQVRFVSSFRHYRSGRLVVAADYGLAAFPIRVRSGSKRRAMKRPR